MSKYSKQAIQTAASQERAKMPLERKEKNLNQHMKILNHLKINKYIEAASLSRGKWKIKAEGRL